MNLQVHTINARLQNEKCTHFQTHFIHLGVIGISQSIPAHTLQYFYHIQFILCIFAKASHFSTETHSNAIPPVRKENGREPKGELIRLSDVTSQD